MYPAPITALTRIVLGSFAICFLVIRPLPAQTADSNPRLTTAALTSAGPTAGQKTHRRSAQGATPLHWVAFQGDAITARQLIVAGADVDRRVNKGSTPLHLAAYNGHTRIVELLIENGADLNIRTDDGITALDWARRNGHAETAALLLDHGARVGKPLPPIDKPRATQPRRLTGQYDRHVAGNSPAPAERRPEPESARAEIEDDYPLYYSKVNLEQMDSVARVNRLLANYRPANTQAETNGAAHSGTLNGSSGRDRHGAAGYRIQLASFRNERRALLAREQFLGLHPDILGGQNLVLEKFNSGSAQYHRVRSGPLPRGTAQTLCQQLQQRDQACILVR